MLQVLNLVHLGYRERLSLFNIATLPLVCYIENVSCCRPKKFVRISRDDYFNTEDHHLSATPGKAEKACAYDLDDTDIAWLDVFNGERAQV